MEEAGNAYDETFLPITTGHYLFLSGTPFRAINSGEFIEDQIYNWTYSDEQRAKLGRLRQSLFVVAENGHADISHPGQYSPDRHAGRV